MSRCPHPWTNPWLTGTSKVSWVSSSIWILTVMSFPEGVGGGFCPRSKVLIPEFSGAPRREAGVGFCSISPMMKAAYMISAGNDKRDVSEERTPLKLPRGTCRISSCFETLHQVKEPSTSSPHRNHKQHPPVYLPETAH